MKQYLVIQLARFGDLIQTKRLLATLCARDKASVHLCVDVSLVELAERVYPDITVHGVTAHGTGLSGAEAISAMLVGNRRAFEKLKCIEFETIYNLNFSPLNFRMAALFAPDRVKGYSWNNGQEIVGLWPSMAMRWSDYRRTGINLVDFWGGYCPDMIAPDKVNPVASSKGGGIGVVLAGRESRRSLPVDILSKVVTSIDGRSKSVKIHLLGGPSEYQSGQALIKELPKHIQDKTENLAGKTDWADLIDIIGSLDELVTPDTGTMHLAAHLGIPVHAFFLSSAWCFETGPYGKGHTVYQAVVDCLPCLETQECHYDVQCLGCFNGTEIQRYLMTGKREHAPGNLTVFASEFDELGQTYMPIVGEDRDAIQRTEFRRFLWQYLSGKNGIISENENVIAQRIYRERDWIAQEKPGVAGI